MRKPKLSELTLREKIGQTACISSGALVGMKNRDEHLKNNPYGSIWVTGNQDFSKDYMSYEEGNYVLGKATSQEVINWLEGVLKQFKIPPLQPTDCETGARDARSDMTKTHPARAYGVTGDEELALKNGICIARELRACGLNWAFAPVVDINYDPDDMRSYSTDAEITSRMICAQIKGTESQGVASCIKHFPSGSPNEIRNPHVSPAENNMSFKEWEEVQGVIYKKAIDEGVMTVMSGYSGFPAVDDTMLLDNVYIPSALSYKVITELLKEKMGFKGVVITDDTGMRAARLHYSPQELYVKLLQAGNDVVLSIADAETDYIGTVEKAVLSGELSEDRINDACQRVLDLKEKLGLFDEEYKVVVPRTDEMIDEINQLNAEVARKSITLTKDDNNFIPLKNRNVKNIAIVVQGATKENCYIHMKNAFEKNGYNVTVKEKLVYEKDLPQLASNNDLIVYLLSESKEFVTIRRALTDNTRNKSIIIGINSPLLFQRCLCDAPTFINAFSYIKETQEALVEFILGTEI